MNTTDLETEYAGLVLPRFDEATALHLGQILVDLALASKLPVVINIRTADRTLFHAAMPGSAPLNDLWAHRKSNTALMFSYLHCWSRHGTLPRWAVGPPRAFRGRLCRQRGRSNQGLAVEQPP